LDSQTITKNVYLEKGLKRLQQTPEDRARHSGDTYVADLVEELLGYPRHVLTIDEQDQVIYHPVIHRLRGDIIRTLVLRLLPELLRLEASVLLEVRRHASDVRQVLEPPLHLTEQCLVELQVFLFHVIEAVTAVDEDHEDQHDVLEKSGCIDNDAHYRKNNHLKVKHVYEKSLIVLIG